MTRENLLPSRGILFPSMQISDAIDWSIAMFITRWCSDRYFIHDVIPIHWMNFSSDEIWKKKTIVLKISTKRRNTTSLGGIYSLTSSLREIVLYHGHVSRRHRPLPASLSCSLPVSSGTGSFSYSSDTCAIAGCLFCSTNKTQWRQAPRGGMEP